MGKRKAPPDEDPGWEPQFLDAVCSELRAIMGRKGWKWADWAAASGIPEPSIRRYTGIRGRIPEQRFPPLPSLERMLRAAGISLADFDEAVRRALSE